jgi:hypothetical protein
MVWCLCTTPTPCTSLADPNPLKPPWNPSPSLLNRVQAHKALAQAAPNPSTRKTAPLEASRSNPLSPLDSLYSRASADVCPLTSPPSTAPTSSLAPPLATSTASSPSGWPKPPPTLPARL